MPGGTATSPPRSELGGVDEPRLEQLFAGQDLRIGDEARELVRGPSIGNRALGEASRRDRVDPHVVLTASPCRALGNRLLHDVHVGELSAVCGTGVRASHVVDQENAPTAARMRATIAPMIRVFSSGPGCATRALAIEQGGVETISLMVGFCGPSTHESSAVT